MNSQLRAAPETGRRRRIAARTRLDFWFDAVLLVAYTLAYSYGFTGIGIHEWLGLGIGLALLIHLTLHWDWVVRTTGRLLRPRGPDKLIWLVNLALLIAMTLCVLSGILISRVALPYLGINLTPVGPHGPVVVRSSGSGGMSLGLNSMFQAVNLPVLRHTVEIEVGVIAAVVILDIARRRLRRFLRARRLPASGPVD